MIDDDGGRDKHQLENPKNARRSTLNPPAARNDGGANQDGHHAISKKKGAESLYVSSKSMATFNAWWCAAAWNVLYAVAPSALGKSKRPPGCISRMSHLD